MEVATSIRSESLTAGQKIVAMLFVMVALWYLHWRLGTFNPDALTFSAIFYVAEVYGFFTAILHLFMVWRLSVRESLPAPAGCSIDVFVPTYNESVDLLRKTLLAAVNMDYPHKTWLLDDSNRPEMRTLAEELGCEYQSRSDNTFGKAGNLNNALQASNGEFIALFDADHAPKRDFLVNTLGYFSDPNVAFVQTPQDFYNLDSYQHRWNKPGQRLWTEQSLFFRVIQRGKDVWNAAFFCGSCAIIRRASLDTIGGFATGTVTEDLHTSLRLHKQGYRSVYHAESLAFGIAPNNIKDFLR
ncbi:MAG: glycosyltransferase, partial [Gammaproteobacteria bacterium]